MKILNQNETGGCCNKKKKLVVVTEPVGCPCSKKQEPTPSSGRLSALQTSIAGGAILSAWFLVYFNLLNISKWITYSLLQITEGSHLGGSVEFFLYDTPKVFMLLSLVVFGVGLLRTFITPEYTRKVLAGPRQFVGNILAALLGVITPFCTCSAVSLFIGFISVGVPLGVTLSFLVAAPLINEVALVLLFGMFGWKIAALYLITGLSIAIIAGIVIAKLKLERYIQPWVYAKRDEEKTGGILTWYQRINTAKKSVVEIVSKVWIYMVIGIAVGAGVHGYMPANYLASIMGKEWYSVPLATLAGVPLYSNAAGVIPVVQALLGKGAAIGTVLAFMMATIGLSLPEFIILRKVLKPQLIAIFAGIVAVGIIATGYLFNFIF